MKIPWCSLKKIRTNIHVLRKTTDSSIKPRSRSDTHRKTDDCRKNAACSKTDMHDGMDTCSRRRIAAILMAALSFCLTETIGIAGGAFTRMAYADETVDTMLYADGTDDYTQNDSSDIDSAHIDPAYIDQIESEDSNAAYLASSDNEFSDSDMKAVTELEIVRLSNAASDSALSETGASDNEAADSDYSDTALYRQLYAEAGNILSELKAMPDASAEEQAAGYKRSEAAYEELSELFNPADEAYEAGSIDENEYAAIIEMLNDIGEELLEQFARFEYDPYAAEPVYSHTISSSAASSYVPAYEWSASYNGSNIIVSFNFSITTFNKRMNVIHVGGNSELLYVAAYGYLHATSDPEVGAQYFKSNFGTVSLSSISMKISGTSATGTITITDPKGFKNWVENGDRSLWFESYSDSDNDVTYYLESGSGISPTVITGSGTAISQGTCTHKYSWTAVDASTHKNSCSSCGYTASTGKHNSNTSDTTTKKGYTIKKCSVCSYTMSTTANTYSVTLNAGTGNSADNITVNAVYGSAMPSITAPKRSGYTFAGFYSKENGGGTQYYNASGKSTRSYDIAGKATLYASWKQNCEVSTAATVANKFGIKQV